MFDQFPDQSPQSGPIAFDAFDTRQFVAENADTLAGTAALLAGQKGLRVVREIGEGLSDDPHLTRWVERRLRQLLGTLHLKNVHMIFSLKRSASPRWSRAMQSLMRSACSPTR